VWQTIIHSAWLRGEPGLLMWDNIINESPADCYADFGFKTVSTNPCGEIPLSAYDSCRLMAINLMYHVENPFTSKAEFNFEKFYESARLGQRLMDDLVDLEEEY
ncbi:MAG: ribonucleoside-diphosphate reductase, adenosylcobalamin-dependent, partial [Candidatus Dadabacteria bacterium]|nr:ribonucleoside-diphosphate reductase, adenosylcobalamin-dependent [Candidatus Dadabacteria bacterium]